MEFAACAKIARFMKRRRAALNGKLAPKWEK
jgi:hypothetical protein